jgi:hypothetical protein
VRVRAAHRDAEDASREHVGGPRAASHERRPCRGKPAVGTLGAPQAELDDRVAARGLAHPRGLGRHEGLEVDDVEQRRLGDLTRGDGRGHPQQRFVGEDDGTLGDGVHIALEAERLQVGQELRVEERASIVAGERGEVGDVPGRERECVQIVERLLEPAPERVPAAEGVVAKREVEAGLGLR